MAEPERDRNLLVGVLAMQMDFITRDQLIDALQRWLSDRRPTLETQLLEHQLIDASQCQFLADLAARHLELHDRSVEKSLASLSSISSVQKAMELLQESDVTQVFDRAKKLRDAEQTIDTGGRSSSAEPLAAGNRPRPAISGDSANRFHILRPHARGGLGIVSVARDNELNREVALKEIRSSYADSETSRSRFLVEAEITGRLEHPGIVPVYSLGQSKSGTPFYVMRFIRGHSLKDAIREFYDSQEQSLDVDLRRRQFRDLIQRLVDVCQAIDYAHSRGVLHRDLKPGNIMLGRYGETLVVDWGLAKSIGRDRTVQRNDEETVVPTSGEGSSETRFGSVVGTLSYMSPEQANGLVDELGPASDVYCLGATLYCVLTGETPIEKSSTVKMIEQVRSGKFVPVKERNPTVDPALVAICEKAMSLEPADRYPTAALMMDDLERWLADVPVQAYPEPWPKRAMRLAKRHRAWVASILAVLLVSIPALLIFGLIVSNKNRQLTAIQADLRDLAVASLNSAELELSSTPGLEQFRNRIMEESFTTLERLHSALPEDREIRGYLAHSAWLAANQKVRTNQASQGEEQMRQAIQLQREIIRDTDDSALDKRQLSLMLRDLCGIQKTDGKLGDARLALDESLSILSELRTLDRDDLKVDYFEAYARLADIGLHYDAMDYAKALQSADRSVELLGEVVRGKSKSDADITSWLLARAWQGLITDELNQYADARPLFSKAIGQARSILKQKPGSRNFQYALSRLLHWDARSSARGAPPADLPDLESHTSQIAEAVSMMEQLHADYPMSNGFHANYAEALIDQALLSSLGGSERWGQALEIAEQALSTAEQLLQNSDMRSNREIVGLARLTQAEILSRAGHLDSSRESVEAALGHFEPLYEQVPENRRLGAFIEKARQIRESLQSAN
ncbi:MAG: serine/threonine protein kinase [bacterium]|nr:serine/threonine protein kinase [bacterium]